MFQRRSRLKPQTSPTRWLVYVALFAIAGCGGDSSAGPAEQSYPTSVTVAGVTLTATASVILYQDTSPRADGTYRCSDGTWDVLLVAADGADIGAIAPLVGQVMLWNANGQLDRGTVNETAANLNQFGQDRLVVRFGRDCLDEILAGTGGTGFWGLIEIKLADELVTLRTAESRVDVLR
jgi:hypothetical protein